MAKRGRRHPRNRRSSAGRNRSRSKSKMKNVVGVDGFNCPNDQTDFTLSELTTQVWETGREGKNEHCSGLNGATPLMKVEGKRHAFSSSTGFSPLRKVRHIVSESSSEEVTISSSCDSPCDMLEPLPLDSQSSVNTPSTNSSDVIAPSLKQHALVSRSLDSSSFDAVSLDSDGICSPSCETPLSGPDLHNRPPLLLHANLSLGSSAESRASSKTRKRKRNRRNKKLKMKEQDNKRPEQDGEYNEDINKNNKSSAKCESAFMKSSHIGETQESPCVPVEDVTLKNCEDEAHCGKKTGEEEVVLVVDEVFLGGNAQEAPNMEEKLQIGNNNDGEIHQKPVGYEEKDTTSRPGHYILSNVEQTDKKTVPEVLTPDADATSQSQIESGGARRRRRKSEVISIEVEGELLYEDDGSSLSEDEQNHLITKGMNGLDRSLKNTMLEITNQVIEKVKSPLKNRNSLHPLDGRKLDILKLTSHGMLSAGVESNVAVFHNQIEYNGTEQQNRHVNQEGNQMTEENVNNEQITGPITSEVSQTNDEIQESVQMCQESHKIDQVIQSDVNQGLEANHVNEDNKITHIRQGTEETDQVSQESEEIHEVSQEIEDVNQASQVIGEKSQVSQEAMESDEVTIQVERINKASRENEEINIVSQETEETDQESQVINNPNQTTQGIEDIDERSQEIKEDSLMSREIEATNHASREIEDLNQLKQRTEETGSKNNEELNQVSPGTEQTSQIIEETNNQIRHGMDDINHLNQRPEESEQLSQEIIQGEEVNQVNEIANSKIEEIDQMRQEMRENICVTDNKPEECQVDRENGNYNQVNQEEKPEDSHATVTQEVKKAVSQLKDEQSDGNKNQINEHLYQENVASGGVIHSNADEGKQDDTLPVEKNQEGYLAEEEGLRCSNGNHLRPEEKPEIVIARTSKRSDGVEEHLGCVFINENLHVLNSAEKVDLVEVIQSQESGQEDIAVYEVKEREALIGLDIPDIRITTEDGSNEVDSHVSGTEDDLEGAVVEVGVLEARDETETDIVIYEVVDSEGEEVMGRSSTAIELQETEHPKPQETEHPKPQETEITKPLHNTSSNADDLNVEGSCIAETKKDAFDDSMDVKDAAATIVAGTVDAALAELDSIPDEVCESGDVEEEEEEEEEWSYFRMEPQTQPQSEDILVQGAPTTPQDPETEKLPETSAMVHDEDIVPVEQPNTKTLSQDDQEVLEDPLDLPSNQPDNLFEASVQEHQELLVPQLDKPPSPMEADQPPALENTPDILQTSMDKSLSMEGNSEEDLNLIDTSVHKVDNIIETNMEPSSPQGSLSPRVPGSPRSVEGFITSVELNTPEESFATNFAVNQHQDMFANNVDQSSGPFSVYVSSSPEPASLDPSLQGPVDLINMSGGMTNGQLEETTTTKTVEESPVEIVHAQSTVEVVAPPSPVDVSGPETQFIMPDQMSTSITGALPSDLEFQQSELSFIPEPVIEPMAEKPVPVYVEDTTPISEPELLDYTADDNIMKPEPVEMMTNLPPEKDVHMEKEFAPASPEPSMPSPIEHIPAFIEPTVDIVEPAMNIVEPAANIVEPTMNIVEPAVNIVEPAVNIVEPAVNIVEPTAPVEVVSSMLADSRISESSEKVEVISEALAEMSVIDKTEVEHVKVDIPVAEVKVDPVAEVKVDKEPSKEPAVGVQAKSPGKTPKTGAKPTPGKTPTPGRSTPARSTPGKSTPAKPTPGKATPSRTPSTKTPTPKVTEKRTPTPKPSPKVPNKAVADKPSSRPAAAARTTTKPTTTGTTRPATTRTTASKAPATKSTPPTRTTDKAPAKPSASARTTTRPATTGASKPAPTRTTPTSRTTPTMTKRPTTAPTKPTDKTDSGRLVNGTGTRPSTARSTTTATTRKPATSTARTNPKPAAEKETKNTTNRILSTSRSSASTARTTTNKTAAAKTDAKTTSRVNGTSTTAKSRTATATRTTTTKTSGVGAKKMVSKKTDQIAGKTTKTEKTEAAVIETTPPLINGENKIADEETSVEVLDKCVVEDIMHTSTEKIITETSQTTSSSEQVVVTTETTEVIVNGDH